MLDVSLVLAFTGARSSSLEGAFALEFAVMSRNLSSFGTGETGGLGGTVCPSAVGLLMFSKRALREETGFWASVRY